MRKFLLSAVFAMSAFGLSAATFAADKPEQPPEDVFKRLDKNSDGKLSLEEFVGKKVADKADKAKAQFAKIDKNSDGSIDLEEFKAARGKKKK